MCIRDRHIDCGQSWARGFIIESAGIICPLLSFNNQYLLEATENNILYSHGLFEENIILYLSTKGLVEEKLDWLEKHIENDKKEYHRQFLNSLKTNGSLNESGFFVRSFSKAKSYFIFTMLSQPFLAEVQPKLFDETDINFKELIKFEKKHPLYDYYIDLSFLNVAK